MCSPRAPRPRPRPPPPPPRASTRRPRTRATPSLASAAHAVRSTLVRSAPPPEPRRAARSTPWTVSGGKGRAAPRLPESGSARARRRTRRRKRLVLRGGKAGPRRRRPSCRGAVRCSEMQL
jgi:hypothetical protein